MDKLISVKTIQNTYEQLIHHMNGWKILLHFADIAHKKTILVITDQYFGVLFLNESVSDIKHLGQRFNAPFIQTVPCCLFFLINLFFLEKENCLNESFVKTIWFCTMYSKYYIENSQLLKMACM